MKISIHDCAVIGDSVTDVLAGKNAGAHTVAVLTGIFTEEELREANPDAILKSINDLPRFLCKTHY
jgi:phosphoglycolate phosphatase